MVDVILADEAAEWMNGLPPAQWKIVAKSIEKLEQFGVNLGFPDSSDVNGSDKYPFRELRAGEVLRPIYIFDKHRDAVVVCGGNKSGNKRFYKEMISKAEKIWEQYLEEQGR